MIKKILIANRGEIACRIIQACRKRHITSVAIFSEADAQSLHVQLADEAYAVGGPLPSESYLNSDTILEVARSAGCDAVHPGYGFLSENAEFARAVEAAGMAWIGPTPECILAMGDKHHARELAQRAGVPVLSGSQRIDRADTPELAAVGAAVGYPLLVKAAGGGGGIGMRNVDKPEDLVAAVRAAQELAAKCFADSTIYLERFISKARHIEIQLFGYGDGRVVHLYERDCSIQRRFQKVIEEAPAPGISAMCLRRMREVAVALAASQQYRGAGTVEFLFDTESEEFYFLEMNTRIQVEHPVTEMITGFDLVAMQIDLAAGEPEVITQQSIQSNGHALECRVYAERPAKGFLPSTGTLKTFKLPPHQPGIRVDTGFCEGMAVTHLYDPLLAKVITWGSTREEAATLMGVALEGFEIEGVQTNVGMLRAIMQHEAMLRSAPTTDFLAAYAKEVVG
jgi:3-methylcrotonyl-CoA carboxylase alpha subunit